MLFGLGVSCRVLNAIVCFVYMYVSCNVSIASVGKRELICLQSFTCNYVVSERFPFPLIWTFHIIIYCLIESSREV